jgi:phosphate/sulfate permease
VKRPASGLITGGIVGLGIAYAGAVGFSAVSGFDNGTAWLAAPIIGPWGAIGARDYEQCRTSTVAEAKRCVRKAVSEVQVITFFAVDGVAQLAGGLVTLAGLLSTKEELVRSDLADVQVSVIPPRQGDPWAISVSGQF